MTIAARIGQLARDQEANAKAMDFCHVAQCIALGQGQSRNAIMAAQKGPTTERVVAAVKTAVIPGSTSDGTFAAPLAYQELSLAFLVSLRNIGVFDAALPFAVDVPLNMQVAVTTTGITAASIGEGQVKVISKISLAASALTPRKAVAIIAVTSELLRMGGAKASRLFQQELSRAVAAETDSKFLSVISTGISASPSTGSNAAAIAADMGALLGALSTGVGSKVFIAMNPSDVKHFAIQIGTTGERAFPGVTINGGDYAGCTVIPTEALSGLIIAFDASQLAMGSTGIELDASDRASVQMDTAPDSPPSASTNMVSLWQMNMAGLRATRYFGCERLRTTAVAAISNVSWGSSNSPA